MLLGAIILVTASPSHAGKIHDAVAKRDLNAIDRALIEDPKTVNSRSAPDFETPLHMAVVLGDPVVVDRLLNAGADPALRSPALGSFTPMQRAVFLGGYHCIIPEARQAEAFIKFCYGNMSGLRALFARRAADLASVPAKEKEARLRVVALMLDRKPPLKGGFKGGFPPLHLAAGTGNPDLVRVLIEAGADVGAKDDSTWSTPLHMAAMQNNDPAVVELLISSGADVDAVNKVGRTPLMIAARMGSTQVIRSLLAHGAATDAEDFRRRSVMCYAAMSGEDAIVRLIYQKGGPALVRDGKPEVLFHAAAEFGSTALADLLLACGVDINLRTAAGFTPLLTASEKGQSNFTQYLIEKGADQNVRTHAGDSFFELTCLGGDARRSAEFFTEDKKPNYKPSILIRLAMKGHLEVMELLLNHGADANSQMEHGVTPLMATLVDQNRQGDSWLPPRDDQIAEVVGVLLKHRANPNQANSFRMTPVDYAAAHCDGRVMKALLAAGGKIDTPKAPGKMTPLQQAAGTGRETTVRVLLDAGADRGILSPSGEGLLHLAAGQGNDPVMKVLLELHLPINATDRTNGATPLHRATFVNSFECTRLLLEAGANPEAKDSFGVTPLISAITHQPQLLANHATDNKLRLQELDADLLGRLRTIDLFIKSGARTDIVFPDANQSKVKTLIEFARENGNPEVVELLQNPSSARGKTRR